MNQEDASRWADEVEKIGKDMQAGYIHMGQAEAFHARYGESAGTRLLMEAMCAWTKIELTKLAQAIPPGKRVYK